MPRAKSTGRKLKGERKKRGMKKYAKKCPKCGQVIGYSSKRIKSSSRIRKKR